MGMVCQWAQNLFKIEPPLVGLPDQIFLFKDLYCGQAGGSGHRVMRICVAMGEGP